MEKTTSTLSNFVWKFIFYFLLLFLYVLQEVRQSMVDKIIKVCKLHFSVECFAAYFAQFPNTTVKTCLLTVGYLPFVSLISGVFLEFQFPEVLGLESFGKSRSKSCNEHLEKTIYFGLVSHVVRRNCVKMWKSLQSTCNVVGKFGFYFLLLWKCTELQKNSVFSRSH